MKTSIKTLLLALAATLSLTSCLNDDEYKPNHEISVDQDMSTAKLFYGRWNVTPSDKSVADDSSVWFTFNQDWTFKKELYDAFSEPGQQNFVAEGKWIYTINKNPVLYITMNENSANTSHTDKYEVVKFNGNSFTATIGGTMYDFTKIINE